MKQCKQGHPLVPDNIYTYRTGRQECRICRKARGEAWKKANPVKVKAHKQAFTNSHPNYTKEYYQSHKTEMDACNRQSRQNRLGEYEKLYFVWASMRAKCRTSSHTNYEFYSTLGITVCPEWESWGEFKSWAIEHGYEPGLCIDRIDGTKDYSPANCRWVTRRENSQNRLPPEFGKLYRKKLIKLDIALSRDMGRLTSLLEEGYTVRGISRVFGAPKGKTARLLEALNLKPASFKGSMQEMQERGFILEEIATVHDYSRERVRQLLKETSNDQV